MKYMTKIRRGRGREGGEGKGVAHTGFLTTQTQSLLKPEPNLSNLLPQLYLKGKDKARKQF